MTIVEELRADAASGDCCEDTSNRMRAAADRIEAQERVIGEGLDKFGHWERVMLAAKDAVAAYQNGWGTLNNKEGVHKTMEALQEALKRFR